jgi:hypothetical protein
MVDLDNIVLEHIPGAIDDVGDDIGAMKKRIGTLKNQYAKNRYANMSNRLVRMDLRVEQIERRLDLADA